MWRAGRTRCISRRFCPPSRPERPPSSSRSGPRFLSGRGARGVASGPPRSSARASSPTSPSGAIFPRRSACASPGSSFARRRSSVSFAECRAPIECSAIEGSRLGRRPWPPSAMRSCGSSPGRFAPSSRSKRCSSARSPTFWFSTPSRAASAAPRSPRPALTAFPPSPYSTGSCTPSTTHTSTRPTSSSAIRCPIPTRTAVFGELAKELLIRRGSYPEERIVVTGSPKFDALVRGASSYDRARTRQSLQVPDATRFLVLATRWTAVFPVFEELVRAIENVPGVLLFVKPHQAESPGPYEEVDAATLRRRAREFFPRKKDCSSSSLPPTD